MNKKIKKIFQSNEPYIFLIIILLGIVVQIRSGQFFTANNIVDLLSAMIVPGLFAIAEFMALIAGGIDVSFPALASLSAYATTKFLLDKNYEGNVLLAFVIAIAIGAVLGAFNGIFYWLSESECNDRDSRFRKYLPGHHAGYFKSKSAFCHSAWNEKLWYRCIPDSN